MTESWKQALERRRADRRGETLPKLKVEIPEGEQQQKPSGEELAGSLLKHGILRRTPGQMPAHGGYERLSRDKTE